MTKYGKEENMKQKALSVGEEWTGMCHYTPVSVYTLRKRETERETETILLCETFDDRSERCNRPEVLQRRDSPPSLSFLIDDFVLNWQSAVFLFFFVHMSNLLI